MMKQSQEMSMSLEQKMTHTLSMKIMEIGQVIFELEEDYKHSLSRQAFAKLQQAKEILQEVASEYMTPMTAERMNNWRAEKEQRREASRHMRTPEPWENWSDEQRDEYHKDILRRMKQGFGGTICSRNN